MNPPGNQNFPRILVAGIGNIFLGDDAFGSEVARRLLSRPQPAGVKVIDYGIRGLDLTYALSDGYDAAILVDACPRHEGEPGTLYVMEPTVERDSAGPVMIDAHSMNPMKVLQAAAAMGACPMRLLLVGCEPAPVCSAAGNSAGDVDILDDAPVEMSRAVCRAVDEAVPLVESLAQSILESLSHPDGADQTASPSLTVRFPPPAIGDAVKRPLPTEV